MQVGSVSFSRHSIQSRNFVLRMNRDNGGRKSAKKSQVILDHPLPGQGKPVKGIHFPMRTHTRFVLYAKLHIYYAQVIDNHTKQVIREIPPKKVLDMYSAIAERFGLLVDEKK